MEDEGEGWVGGGEVLEVEVVDGERERERVVGWVMGVAVMVVVPSCGIDLLVGFGLCYVGS